MLSQCEFNGRKDVLHFKLLQAALEENVSEKNSQKMYENLDEIRKSSDEEQDALRDYEEKRNSGNRNQLKNEYHSVYNQKNIRNDIGSKKKKVSFGSIEPGLESHSIRKHENPFLSTKLKHSKRALAQSHSLPLSKHKKLRRNPAQEKKFAKNGEILDK